MFQTAREIRDAVRRREVSAVETCRDALARIDRSESRLHAFIRVDRERALDDAARVDARTDALDHLPLAGVPIAIKDNISTAGIATTAGSRILEGYVPAFDATVVRRLREAGAVILGKTNCDEFAMGSSTEHSAFGPSRNPWSTDRAPGGSSGGSAVAVAAGMTPAALGSDTGGSVRQPAAFCGVVGFKPTYGRVSRYGLIAFASSFDQVGPIARTVADAALLLSVIAGVDGADATSAARPVPDYAAALTGDVRGVRIGVPHDVIAGADPEVVHAFDEAVRQLGEAGAVIVDVALPHASFGIPTYYLVATAEASANLARYDGVRYGYRAPGAADLAEMYGRTRGDGFGPEVKRRIMLGTYALSAGYHDAYYLKAQQVRTLIRRDYDAAFERCDLVALPTTPGAAFRLGERLDDPLQMYLADVFTVGAPLAGLPALSLPCGFTDGRLPIGLQLTGRAFDEETVLRTADAYEHLADWWKATPEDLATDDQQATENR